MSRVQALKFLVLQTLNKNKSKLSGNLHSEIAKSLQIMIIEDQLVVQWLSKGKKMKEVINNQTFNFYIKSEFEQASDVSQIEKNESNARDLVLKIIKLSSV